HDAAAVRLGAATYLFGGGNGTQQLADIVRIDSRTGAARTVGALPAACSDVAAAVVDGTAYVVGGYTGTRWLDSIVAWRPGAAARPSPSERPSHACRQRLRRRHRRQAQRDRHARAAARLRPQQPQQHGRRDRPADVPSRTLVSGRRAAAARDPVLGSEDALR